MIETPEHIWEKNLAQLVLNKSALKASEVMDAFSNWLLAGFGAALALILANLGCRDRLCCRQRVTVPGLGRGRRSTLATPLRALGMIVFNVNRRGWRTRCKAANRRIHTEDSQARLVVIADPLVSGDACRYPVSNWYCRNTHGSMNLSICIDATPEAVISAFEGRI